MKVGRFVHGRSGHHFVVVERREEHTRTARRQGMAEGIEIIEAEHRSRAVWEIGTDSVGQDGTRGTEGVGDRGCQRWIFRLPQWLFPSIARFA